MSVWHVYFPPDPWVIAHICDEHRAIGQTYGCADGHALDADGNCEHVRTLPCDCGYERQCAPCVDEAMRQSMDVGARVN